MQEPYPNLHSLSIPSLQFLSQGESVCLDNPNDQTTNHQNPSWQRWMPFLGNGQMDQSAIQCVAAHIFQMYHSASLKGIKIISIQMHSITSIQTSKC